MAYNNYKKNTPATRKATTPATDYNTKIKITTLAFTRDGDRHETHIPYLSLINAYAYPKRSKSGKPYLRLCVTGKYSIDAITRVYEDIPDNADLEPVWVTAFLPNDKSTLPDAEKIKLSACGTLRYTPDGGYTMSIDYYSANEC